MSLRRFLIAASLMALLAPSVASADRLTVRGTQVFKSVAPNSGAQFGDEYAVFNGSLYFVANDDVHGSELWRTDGTNEGTALVADLRPGTPADSSNPHRFTVVGNRLFFNAYDPTTQSSETVFYIDASAPTTVKQLDAKRVDNNVLVKAAGTIIGAPNGRLLFVRLLGESSNCCYALYSVPPGDTAGSKISVAAEDVNANNSFSPAATAGGWTYYSRSNTNVRPGQGAELWRSDGQTTEQVKDIFPGASSNGSAPSAFFATSDRVYFTATDGTRGRELWVTNPADKADTHIVYEHTPGSAGTSINDPGQAVNGNILYYTPVDPVTGPEVWRTDGTPGGTRVVKDITPGTGGVSQPLPFALGAGLGILRGADVFASLDGSEAATQKVGEVSGDGYGPNNPLSFGDRAYFVGGATPFGQALWRTDGTVPGTLPISAGGFDGTNATGGNPSSQTLARLGDKLIFFSRDQETNNSGAVKMYVLDTTQADEQRVATVAPAITGIAAVGNRLDASQGTWSTRPSAYTYQWLRNGQPIDKADFTYYFPNASDIGQTVSVRVTTTGIGAPREASAESAGVTIGGTAPATPKPNVPVTTPKPVATPTPVPIWVNLGKVPTTLKAGKLSISVKCPAAEKAGCQGKLTLTTESTKAGKTTTSTLGSASFKTIKAGKSKSVSITVSSKYRTRLKSGSLKVTVTAKPKAKTDARQTTASATLKKTK